MYDSCNPLIDNEQGAKNNENQMNKNNNETEMAIDKSGEGK